MKSRQRPPLNLSSLDPVEQDQNVAEQPETADETHLDIDRPMSERRRRRLAEEQTRQAQARAEALAQVERDVDPGVIVPSMAAPVASTADAALAPYTDPIAPAGVHTRKGAAPSEGRAYLIAGLASAAWVAAA